MNEPATLVFKTREDWIKDVKEVTDLMEAKGIKQVKELDLKNRAKLEMGLKALGQDADFLTPLERQGAEL